MVTIVALEMGLVRHVYPAGWGRVDSAYTASLTLLALISGMCNVVVYAETLHDTFVKSVMKRRLYWTS